MTVATMLLVVVEIEAAVFTRGLVIVTAFTLTIVAGLGRGANLSAFTTICLVGLQIHAYLIADVGAAYTLSLETDLFRPAGLIAAAAVRRVGECVDAGVVTGHQRLDACLHALPLGAKANTGFVATTTVIRVGVGVDASIPAGGLALLAYESTLAQHTRPAAGTRMVAVTAVLL
jgi:hypothetical protein